MRAIVISSFGGPEVLQLAERPEPTPSRGEVLIRVRATAVNRADLLQRMGLYPAPADAPQDIPGLEYAGEVAALGPEVSQWQLGDRVFGLAGGGTYAEALVAHERAIARIPEGMTFTDAAAIPEAFITAYDAMVTQAGLRGGEPLLIHAVGSGVGTAAVQLGHALGAVTIGTARSVDKLERAKHLGLHHGVLSEGGKFAEAVSAIKAPRVILDLVGGDYVGENLRCVEAQGRIAVVGLTGGAKTQLDLALLLRKRVRLVGTVLRSRPLEEKIAAMRVFSNEILPLFHRGALKPIVEAVVPLAEAGRAHERVASNRTFGKLVLNV